MYKEAFMSKVVVMGHGGYATAMKRNLAMLVGEMEDFYYIDFNEEDSLDILQGKLNELLAGIEDAVLFVCDLAGGSPFRTAALCVSEHPGWAVVAGVNTSAFSELSFNTELTPAELAKLAIDVTKDTVMVFPPEE